MASPPPAHAPVDSDDPAVLNLGPCAAAYVELEVRMREGKEGGTTDGECGPGSK